MTVTSPTVPSNLVIMLADNIAMRTDEPWSQTELERVTTEIAETEAHLRGLRASEVLLRLDLLPDGVADRLMDLARAIHFDTIEGADRHVSMTELARRLVA